MESELATSQAGLVAAIGLRGGVLEIVRNVRAAEGYRCCTPGFETIAVANDDVITAADDCARERKDAESGEVDGILVRIQD